MPQIKLFFGDEDFLIDEEIKKMAAGINADMNYERIDGSKADTERLISAMTMLPMLGGDRLVVIEDLDLDEKDEQKFFDALGVISEGTRVVFVNYGSVDKRRRFYKHLDKIGEVKEFKRLSDWEQDKALAWVYGRAKTYGKKIGGRTAALLVEIVGLNLRMLDKELEKISTFVGERDTIEEADVSAAASAGELDSFALSNSIQAKDVQASISSLEMLFADNADPQMIIGMLAKGYRMLMQVKSLEGMRLSQFEIAGRLKAKPYFVKKCMERTARFSERELARNIGLLHEADLKVKSGYPPRMTLEMLIPELCHA